MSKEHPAEALKEDSPTQFKQQFDLLSTHTPEYEITVPYIVDTIIDNLPQCGHFIDVGTGRGNLAKPLSSYFDVTTVIEPNQLYHDEVLAWASENGRKFHGKNTDWLNANMAGIGADLVLMSHVMYYVDQSAWSNFVRKAYELLHPGGQVVIILNSWENSITDLYKQFLPRGEWLQIASSEAIIEIAHEDQYAEVNVKSYESNIIANSPEKMYELMDFLLLHRVDFEDTVNQEMRRKYAEAYLRKGENYVIWAGGHIISITKPL